MENTSFMRVEEVAQELGISKSYAYKIVQKLNEELKNKGFLTISGRVNKQYFMAVSYTHLFRPLPAGGTGDGRAHCCGQLFCQSVPCVQTVYQKSGAPRRASEGSQDRRIDKAVESNF